MNSYFFLIFTLYLTLVAAEVDLCEGTLDVVILGPSGSGKSTLINVLNNLTDLSPGDSKSIVTDENYYHCSFGEKTLRVVKTPGLQYGEENIDIGRKILRNFGNFYSGVDTILFLYPTWTFDAHMVQLFDSLEMLLTNDGFKHMIVVFTFADHVQLKNEDETNYIDTFKSKMLKFAPQASHFLDSAKYRFYRHFATFDGQNALNFIESRKRFVDIAYEEIYKTCVANKGEKYTLKDMKRNLEKYQERDQLIQEFAKKRHQIRYFFEDIFKVDYSDDPLGRLFPRTTLDIKK